MSIYDELKFAPVLITDVFETMKSSKSVYDKVHLKPGSGANLYLSQTQSANSIAAIVADQDLGPESGNCITITLKTQATFYQPSPFYTAQNFLLFRHPLLSQASGVVLVTALRRALEKFSWGYGVSMARLKKTHVMVPVVTNDDGEQVVDWDGMTRLGEELFGEIITHTHSARQTDAFDDDSLPDLRFEPMLITDVFDEYRQAPAWLNTNRVASGEPAFAHVTNSASGNSVSGFIAHQGFDPNPGNAITVGIDTQVVAYQLASFYGATKVYELRSPHLNEASAQILVSALKKSIEKFSWGHKASAGRLSKTRIMVPVTTDATGKKVVDWEGMSQYGRALRVRAERHVFGEAVMT